MICIKGGLIHDAVNPTAWEGDILIENGKIKEMGTELSVPPETEILHAEGLFVYPGFIDAHSHLGLANYACGFEGRDYNEMTDILSPQLRGIDSINPMDPTFRMAAEGELPVSLQAQALPMYWGEPLQQLRQPERGSII